MESRKYSAAVRTVWWVYTVLLFVFVVVKFDGSLAGLRERMTAAPIGPNYNLRPFYTIRIQLMFIDRGWAKLNLLGNTVSFLPFGYLLPLAYPRLGSFAKVFLTGLGSVLLIEVFQFYTRLGSFDVDDVMLNMAGIAAGYLLMRSAGRAFPKKK